MNDEDRQALRDLLEAVEMDDDHYIYIHSEHLAAALRRVLDE